MKKTRTVLSGLLAATAVFTAACGTSDSPDAADTGDVSAASCEYTVTGGAAKDVNLPPAEAPQGTVSMTLETNVGDIPLSLDGDRAPCTVNAISHLARSGYYDDTVCHRITTAGIYVLQCGDPTGRGSGGPGFSYADEYPVGSGDSPTYAAGVLAMANAGPGTNGSQFFMNYRDSPLPPSYTMFGTVEPDGMKVLGEIAEKGAVGGAPDGAPAEEIRIEHVTVD
ncbi:peptidylprolyl isomerase [Corynebacterium pygosceleis]|uniref:Peptidyl-prolyl cis-trans isomerase n=1 Tax=Corynebacterium pygosceleis TaxID=2800406 RepID=A0A9Q4C8D9_9CORY|nr:peptidylprolyl isomerase [Corynebacterium pygosceleis]MCK7637673.1 peptidylprolyl isomerase [Corynebacterium pygosceleis]MCK7674864.1 peptidylprolyl isomerase [Corynebacterium pygosceleis]MCL0119547.1 peptidylprolyl isomerase [Corynebacterium pygosceleis]MCX7444787.1 peptidylprolyl isomerase [Corynebacterium pygosceleis]MCX7467998.1 peptidylprolyl isomerase [Corynebacterium pygosceleis]